KDGKTVLPLSERERVFHQVWERHHAPSGRAGPGLETGTELWRGILSGVDPAEDTGGKTACHPEGRTTDEEKAVCGACEREPAEEKNRRTAGAVPALLFPFRYPAEKPPACIPETTSFSPAGRSGETGTNLQRDKAALPLSH